MTCEYINENNNAQGAACRTTTAIGQIYHEMDGVFTIAELRIELCLNENSQAREQCPAYNDLKKHGRSSFWSK